MSTGFSGGRQPRRRQRRQLEDAEAFARTGSVGFGPPHSDHHAAVSFDGVSTDVDGRRVLSLVDLDIARGSLTAVAGLTGLAKSAFIEHLLGRRAPDQGSLHVLGWPVPANAHVGDHRDRPVIGIVPRTGGLLSSLTVTENVGLLLANGSGVPDEEIRERVHAELAALDLLDIADDKPDDVALGRRKLVAYARARVQNPALIVFDEPAAGLDRERAAMMFDLIASLKAEAPGLTFVVISQDLPLSCRIADPLVLFSHGTPVAHGPVAELVRSPNPHVRALVQEASGLS